ncbi:Hypothetical predicted protein [Cloeon dipterum]|nr:Hypothetical predicted protein [Cloeon dipterum]
MIAADAPNVQSLIINGRYATAETDVLLGNIWLQHILDQATLESICSLSKLKRLEISRTVELKFPDLMQICETLQFLEHVDVKIVGWNELEFGNIDKFKRSFSRLKVFRFLIHGLQLSRQLVSLCIEHLPKLRLMHEWDLNDFDIPDVCEILELPPQTSSLMNLGVISTTLPIHRAFPCVRHLTIDWPDILDSMECSIDSLLHFSKLESLFLHSPIPSEKIFYQLLDHYGSNLKKLFIKSFQFKLRIGDIMNRCKKLESLAFLQLVSFSDQSLKPTQTFTELKELTWAIPIFVDSKDDQHLVHLLSSPKLEKVTITLDEDNNVDPLKEISNLIADGQILRELKSLTIYFYHSRNGAFRIFPRYEAVNSLITNACAFLPKLTRVVLAPFGWFCLGLRPSSHQRAKIDYDFSEFGQPNLGKFLFACRTG